MNEGGNGGEEIGGIELFKFGGVGGVGPCGGGNGNVDRIAGGDIRGSVTDVEHLRFVDGIEVVDDVLDALGLARAEGVACFDNLEVVFDVELLK